MSDEKINTFDAAMCPGCCTIYRASDQHICGDSSPKTEYPPRVRGADKISSQFDVVMCRHCGEAYKTSATHCCDEESVNAFAKLKGFEKSSRFKHVEHPTLISIELPNNMDPDLKAMHALDLVMKYLADSGMDSTRVAQWFSEMYR